MYWTSSTQWEKSLYGGFEKILYDYPRIKTSFDLDYDFHKESKLPYYLKTKLADITQVKVKHFKLEAYLAADAKIEVSQDYLGNEKKYIVPTKKSLGEVVNYIAANDAELSSLFEHYRDEIINTKFLYDVTENEKFKEHKDGDIIKKSDKPGTSIVNEAISKTVSETEKFEYKPSTLTSFSSDFADLKKKTTFYNVSGKIKDIRKVTYDSNEETAAKKLLDLLDVNFDPKSDKVDNLRNGKLDIAKIATVHSGNTRVYYKVEENISTKPFAVCILMDESGSMGHLRDRSDSSNAFYQHSLVKILYKTFSQIIPKDKIYVYGHSGDSATHSKPEIRIYHDPYNQKFEECFEGQSRVSFNENYDGVVIEKIYDEIRSKTSENILFISISDGQPSGCNYGGGEAIDEMKRVIEKCRRDGFVTVGIGFKYDGVKDIYSYSSIINDLNNTPKIVSTLLNKVVKLEFQNDD
jgi:hypothetical protein